MSFVQAKEIMIDGKAIRFVKPPAFHLMAIEDSAMKVDGTMDAYKYYKGMLKLLSPALKIDDIAKRDMTIGEIELSNDRKFSFDMVSLQHFFYVMPTNPNASINRVESVQYLITELGIDIPMHSLTYDDISNIHATTCMLYDITELARVCDEVATFCISSYGQEK